MTIEGPDGQAGPDRDAARSGRRWAADFRGGLRALSEGRPACAVARLEAARAATPHAVVEAILLRDLAEAYLLAGRFAEACDVAEEALRRHLAAPTSRRRRVEAWTTLGLARSLADRPGDGTDAYREAVAAAGPEGLPGALAGARLARLRARACSAAGALADAQALLDEAAASAAGPTRRSRREALHIALERAIVCLRQSRFGDAIAGFESVARDRGALLGPHHPETLTARHNLAVALRRTSRRREALDIVEAVAAARCSVLGDTHPDTLVSRSFACLQRAEQGGARAECAPMEEVLAAACASLGDRHLFTLQIAGRLAAVLTQAGRPRDALRCLERWALHARDWLGADHPEAGSLLHEYGNALRNAGRLSEAYGVFGELAQATWAARGGAHLETLATFNSLAVVTSDLGLEDTAEAIYRAMIETFRSLGDEQEVNAASVQTNLGHLLLAQGRLAEARTLFSAALAARERKLEPGHRLLHLSRSNLAATLAREGRCDEALALHRQVLADRIRHYGPADPDTLATRHNVGTTLDESGRPEEAVEILREVVAARREVLGPDHPHVLASMRGLAGALSSCGRWEEAELLYREIIGRVEELRASPTLPDEARRSLFAQYVPVYRALALHAVGDGEARDALALAERIKARTLIERLGARAMLRAQATSPEEKAAIAALEGGLAAAEARIAATDDVAARQAATVERDRLAATLRGRERAALEAVASPPASSAAGPERIGAQEASISYIAHGDRVAAVWAGGGAGIGCADLGRIPRLASTVAAARAVLAHPGAMDGLAAGRPPRAVWALPEGGFELGPYARPPADGSWRLTDPDALLASLSEILLEGLPAALFTASRLTISPDGPLAALPFEALSRDGRFLVQDHDVAYRPSLGLGSPGTGAAASGPGERAAPRIPLVAIGNPSFALADEPATGAAGDALLAAVREAPGQALARWRPLPGSAAELSAVAAIYGLREGETLFTGPAASLETVRALAASGTLARADGLLFSTHGLLDPRDARRHALVLATGKEGPGMLTAAEIAALDLTADVVVLAACDTGGGRFQDGEGLLGLPFAFAVAGARAVVQTAWPIDDRASASFVERLFAAYRQGIPAVRALAQVKRAFIADPVLRSPAYWAPFLHYGA